ncbi:uncharacterized protein [Argopecten irradians]|uniref:uncharacterized protein isoform X1 n=1 Tax=Argopecten irradians TaxID=31199 RepID=UPI003719C2B7
MGITLKILVKIMNTLMYLTKRIVVYSGIINIFLVVNASFQSLNEREIRHTACYGNGHQSFIDANCSDAENIYPIRLIAGAKPSSSGCPAEMEWDAPDSLVQGCCVPDSDLDCQAPVNTYIPDGASNYLDTCVGRTMCRKRPAFRMDVLKITTCNSSIYPTQTHYLYLDYYCIPDSNIGRFPLVNETNDVTGSLIYLQGSEYPSKTSVTAMTCSLETDCFEFINIYGMHIYFEQDNVTCNQTMVLSDTSGTL